MPSRRRRGTSGSPMSDGRPQSNAASEAAGHRARGPRSPRSPDREDHRLIDAIPAETRNERLAHVRRPPAVEPASDTAGHRARGPRSPRSPDREDHRRLIDAIPAETRSRAARPRQTAAAAGAASDTAGHRARGPRRRRSPDREAELNASGRGGRAKEGSGRGQARVRSRIEAAELKIAAGQGGRPRGSARRQGGREREGVGVRARPSDERTRLRGPATWPQPIYVASQPARVPVGPGRGRARPSARHRRSSVQREARWTSATASSVRASGSVRMDLEVADTSTMPRATTSRAASRVPPARSSHARGDHYRGGREPSRTQPTGS